MKRIDELESLRGVMAMWVVINHMISAAGLHSETWWGPLKLLGRGVLAVDVFIILSGFVIFLLLDVAKESYGRFIARRFLRVFPAYFVCLLLAVITTGLALEALRSLPWQHAHNLDRIRIFENSIAYALPHIIAHLTLLQGAVPDSILPSSAYAFIGQAWSVSLEWQFYLVAPLLLYIFSRRGFGLAAVALLVIVALHAAFAWYTPFLPAKAPLFLAGALSYYGWKHLDAITLSGTRLRVALTLAAVTLALLTRSIPILIWAVVFVCLISDAKRSAGTLENVLLKPLRHAALRFLGKISYSVYLCHMVVIYCLMFLLRERAVSMSNEQYFALLIAIATPLTLGLSALLYAYVEKPFIELGRKRVSQPQLKEATA